MAGNALLDALAILGIADVRPGMRVADFGAGRTGHLVVPAARIVGEDGAVYAVDIHPDVLATIQGHRSDLSLTNLYPVRGDIERYCGVDLAPRSLDRIFVLSTLSATRELATLVSEARRLLASDGRIIVVDWDSMTRHPVAPVPTARLIPEAVDKVFTDGGCVKCAEFRAGHSHWGRIYSH